MKLSVIIPVYNEKRTISFVLERVRAVPIEKEIIIVDGNSIDGTKEILKLEENKPDTKIIYEDRPSGRGAALKKGLKIATGDLVIFQDADLELDPMEYPKLLEPIQNGQAIVVFGSRFLGKSHKYMNLLQYFGNKLLTFLVNLLYKSHLTDVETCYQVFPRKILEDIKIKSNDFNFTIELTVKLLKKGYKIKEIPVTYIPRGRREGKKIRWIDGLAALYVLFKYRIFD